MTNPKRNIAVLVLSVLAAACVQPVEGPGEDAVLVGALLPFTGDIAASGTNLERAIRMAVEQVDDAGGLAGRPLALRAIDTHSELKRGLRAADTLLEDPRVLALVGPENEDLAGQLVSRLLANGMVEVSGGVTSPTFTTMQDGGFWFRTCPSALEHGRRLAERMVDDGVRSANILYVGDAYGTGFAGVLVNEFSRLGITSPVPVSFQPDQTSFNDELQQVYAGRPEALVLIAYPASGAEIVREWTLLGGVARWYLTPALKSDQFIDNVPPGLLDGAVGVAARPGSNAASFAQAFSERYDGDFPLDAAGFYYDATALILLAAARASADSGGVPARHELKAWLQEVSGPEGSPVRWNELAEGIALAASGQDLDYQGVTGSVDLNDRGDLVEGLVQLWKIEEDRILDLN